MLYRFLPIITILVTVLATAWISLLPLNGVSQADISNRYSTLITPAGFTFSIWSLIYLSWIIVGLLIAFKKIEIGKKLKVVFSFSTILTAFWLIPWHNDKIFTSLMIMLMILAGFSYLFLHTRKKEISLLFRYTIELTYGWIIAATLLNVFALMTAMNTIPDSQSMLSVALIGLFVGTVIQIGLLNGFKAFIPTFVYIWALWGIYTHQSDISIRLGSIFFAIILVLNYIYIRKETYLTTIKKNFGKKESGKNKQKKKK